MNNTLTCVYCGKAYPESTPPHGSKILTDHIKVCEKHPLRQAESKIEKLQKEKQEILKALKPFVKAIKAHYPSCSLSIDDLRKISDIYKKYTWNQ